MQITMDMMLHALQEKDPSVTVLEGSSTVYIEKLQLFTAPPAQMDASSLYLRNGKLFTGTPQGSAGEGISGADLVLQCWKEIADWEMEICELLTEPSRFDAVMSMGRRYLPHNYCLIDREMQLLYVSDRQAQDINTRTFIADNPHSLNEEMIQALLAEQDFHAVISRKKPFYYHFLYTDSYSYCRNIFYDQKYYFRLVMYLEDTESRLEKWEEDFYQFFSEKVQVLCRLAIKSGYRHTSDLLHHVCHALLFGESIDPTTVSYAMQQAGWQPEQNFLVMKLVYPETSGWQVAPETSLPFLVSMVEQNWPQSCAFSGDRHIICIVNLTKSAEAASCLKEELRIFYQKLAPFIRENVCHAGISAVFHDMLQLPEAAEEAAYALKTGPLHQPQYWYFLFEDFHLEYLLDSMVRTLPSLALQDPILSALERYDRTHEDALLDTLRAYLDNGMNMTKAAESLYIHRTTFCRRMDRIRTLTGLNPEDSEEILRLWILLKSQRNRSSI